MTRFLAVLALMLLSACAVPAPGPIPQAPGQQPAAPPEFRVAARDFAGVVDRVLPVAEQLCLRETTGVRCDYAIAIVTDPQVPPNAFQTIGEDGQPVVGFTLTLIGTAQNTDEIAFILGHEAAHHIAGHIPRGRQAALTGATIAGEAARALGGDSRSVDLAVRLGATVGARRFAKEFELEADALGTSIAARAGFDPVRGAAYFTRIPDPGNRFLGTHPPNADRIATVRRVAAGL